MALVESELVEYLHRKADEKKIPISGVFEVSPICNMDCKMCYIRKSAQDVEKAGGLMSMEQWLKLAGQAKEAGMLFILLTGGEPFLRKDFKQLYGSLHEMGFVLSINSNATMITEETIKWLKKMPPSRVNVTVYGAGNRTYERLCNNPSGYDQMKRGVQLLKEAGIAVKLNASVTPDNIGDLEGMIQFANEQELIMEMAPYMFPPLRKDASKVGDNDRLGPEETAKTMAKITYLQYGRDYLNNQMCAWKEQQEEDRAQIAKNPVKEGSQLQCRAGSCTCWITWDGRMLPCGMMVTPVTYPMRDGFPKAWEELREAVEEIRLPLQCSNCEKKQNCHTCAAMIYAETGTYDQVPGYRCRMTMSYPGACEDILAKAGEQHEK